MQYVCSLHDDDEPRPALLSVMAVPTGEVINVCAECQPTWGLLVAGVPLEFVDQALAAIGLLLTGGVRTCPLCGEEVTRAQWVTHAEEHDDSGAGLPADPWATDVDTAQGAQSDDDGSEAGPEPATPAKARKAVSGKPGRRRPAQSAGSQRRRVAGELAGRPDSVGTAAAVGDFPVGDQGNTMATREALADMLHDA